MRALFKLMTCAALATILAALAACGGSNDAPAASSMPQAQGAQSFESIDFTASSPAADVDKFVAAATPTQKHALHVGRQLAAQDSLMPPDACKRMYLGSLGLQCMLWGSGVEPHAGGSTADDIAPANPWCVEIPVGVLVQGVAPAPGDFACYQFVINALTSVTVQAALPTHLLATAELYAAMANGAGFKYADSQSPTSPLQVGGTSQFTHMVLVIRSSNGAGGELFNLGINVPAPQALPANDTRAQAQTLGMNEWLNGKLAAPLSTAYYFIPFIAPSQTSAILTPTFTANQRVGFRAAQKTATGTFNVQAETVLSSGSGATHLILSPYPANPVGTTTPSGVLVRVYGVSASAPNDEPFSFRVGVKNTAVNSYDISNTESISRYYPASPIGLQVANYVDSFLVAKDGKGRVVKGQPVRLTTHFNLDAPNSNQIEEYRTDINGRVSIRTTLASCSGAVESKSNYGPFGSPTDHWNGTAQYGTSLVQLIGTQPNFPATNYRQIPFVHICSESYLGNY